MKQITQNYKTGELKLEEVPKPAVRPGGVLVQNAYSLISVGTERQSIENARKTLLGKARARPEQAKQVIQLAKQQGLFNAYRIAMNRLSTPSPLGYSSAGLVIEVGEGVTEFKVGDRVACAGGGYANHAEFVFVPKNLCARVPDNVSLDHAAFTTLGAIALQGIRRANLKIGEDVAVVGLGLLGQLVSQILLASNCNVLGIDIDPQKVSLALDNGITLGAVRGNDDIEKSVKSLSKGYGMDAVIITAATKSNDPIELAGKIVRDRGRIVVLGNTRMEIPWKLYYEKELDLRLSRSYGPGRYDHTYEEKGIDYPIGYVRWTEKRNMKAFLDLVAKGNVNLDKIITHRFKFEEAEKAYKIITGETKENFVGVLFKYETGKIESKEIEIKKPISQFPISNFEVNVGVIGAGHFATDTLLPYLKKINFVNLKAVATASGLSAKNVAKKFGFAYATSDYRQILDNPDINAVLIATRHDLHAKLVIESLKKGKVVYVEKPLALNENELNEIIKVHNQLITNDQFPRLMVGFNRRFTPFAEEVKNFFENRKNPLMINYRINAGFIPRDNWYQDPEEGGGRIIGEVSHFVDLMQYIIGSYPIRVFAEGISSENVNLMQNDNVNISIKFKDGSIGTISYIACGDPSFSKERFEVFGEDSVAVIDDFKVLSLVKNGKERRIKKFGQDKGHKAELQAFAEAIQKGDKMPIPFLSLVSTTLTTFKILESLNKGIPVEINSLLLTNVTA